MRSSRYEAVKSTGGSATPWCDNTFTRAPLRLSLPPSVAALPGISRPNLPTRKAVWVNLWATWCQPCLREMPLLLAWQEELRKDGVEVELLFLSVDDEGETLAKFLAEHKEIPVQRVLRATSLVEYQAWLKTYGSDPSAAIPIHLMAGADGNVRCLRVGSLRESDYPKVRALFR